MKKLNRKGFTLIELLAIIVILAIIMVVTIPTVLSSLGNARLGQLQNASDSVEKWFEDQSSLGNMSEITGGADANYTTFVGATGLPTVESSAKVLTAAVLSAAGIADPSTNLDLTNSKVYLKGTRVCVKLTAKSGGKFYTNGGTNSVTSGGCA